MQFMMYLGLSSIGLTIEAISTVSVLYTAYLSISTLSVSPVTSSSAAVISTDVQGGMIWILGGRKNICISTDIILTNVERGVITH